MYIKPTSTPLGLVWRLETEANYSRFFLTHGARPWMSLFCPCDIQDFIVSSLNLRWYFKCLIPDVLSIGIFFCFNYATRRNTWLLATAVGPKWSNNNDTLYFYCILFGLCLNHYTMFPLVITKVAYFKFTSTHYIHGLLHRTEQ